MECSKTFYQNIPHVKIKYVDESLLYHGWIWKRHLQKAQSPIITNGEMFTTLTNGMGKLSSLRAIFFRASIWGNSLYKAHAFIKGFWESGEISMWLVLWRIVLQMKVKPVPCKPEVIQKHCWLLWAQVHPRWTDRYIMSFSIKLLLPLQSSKSSICNGIGEC